MRTSSLDVGSIGHLGATLLQHAVGVALVHATYRGSVPVLPDLMNGTSDFGVDQMTPGLPLLRNGRLRALAVGARAHTGSVKQAQALAGFAAGDPWLPPARGARLCNSNLHQSACHAMSIASCLLE